MNDELLVMPVVINDNMRLHHIKTDKFKTCAFSLLLRNPLERENATTNALLPLILKRGSRNYPDIRAIQAKQEDLYGAIFDACIMKKGEEQLLQFYMECLDSDGNTGEALAFLKEIMFNILEESGSFLPDYTESAKKLLGDAILSRKSDRREYAKLRCVEEMCKDEPFGIYGDGYFNDIEKCNGKELRTHYLNMRRCAPVELIAIGNCDTERLADEVSRLFGDCLGHGLINEIGSAEELKQRKKGELNTVTEEADVSQGKLCVGIRANAGNTGADFCHLQLANEILGGSPESRLFKGVREKEGLCYYISSFVYRFKSIIIVESGIDKKSYDKTSDMINNELEDVKNGKFSNDEMEKAKTGIIKKLRQIPDYQSRIMDFHLTRQMLNDSSTINDMIKNIENATKEDCVNSLNNAYVDTQYFLSPK